MVRQSVRSSVLCQMGECMNMSETVVKCLYTRGVQLIMKHFLSAHILHKKLIFLHETFDFKGLMCVYQ